MTLSSHKLLKTYMTYNPNKSYKLISHILYFLFGTFLFTSCGLVDVELDEVVETAVDIDLGRDTIYVMQGDQYIFQPRFTPDSLSNLQVFYQSSADSVVHMVGDTVKAVSEGWATISAISVSSRLPDSCHVCVIKRWEIPERVYPYETVIYARVTVKGKPVEPHMIVAAFCEGEVRAFGQSFEHRGVSYMRFRVGSTLPYLPEEEEPSFAPGIISDPESPDDPEDPENPEDLDEDDDDDGPYEPYQERIYFRLYDPRLYDLHLCGSSLYFDGEAHGTLSNLYQIDFK